MVFVCAWEHTGKKEASRRYTRTKNTHRETPDFNKAHTWSAAAGPVEPTARRFGRLWVLTQQPFGTNQASHHPDRSEWAQFFFSPPRSPSSPQRSPLQITSFDGGSTQPTKLPPQDIISSILALKPPVCWTRNLRGRPVQLLRALFSHPPALCYATFICTCHMFYFIIFL